MPLRSGRLDPLTWGSRVVQVLRRDHNRPTFHHDLPFNENGLNCLDGCFIHAVFTVQENVTNDYDVVFIFASFSDRLLYRSEPRWLIA